MYGVMDGEKIEALRQERGLSRRELAREAGISTATVSKAERGGRVRGRTGWRLARGFGVHPSEIAVQVSEYR